MRHNKVLFLAALTLLLTAILFTVNAPSEFDINRIKYIFGERMYFPSPNLFTLRTLCGLHVNAWFYLAAAMIVCLVMFFDGKRRLSLSAACLAVVIVLTVLYGGLQARGQTIYLKEKSRTFGHRDINEKRRLLFGEIYTASEAILAARQDAGSCSGKLVTDLSTDRAHSLEANALAYFLYPTVNLVAVKAAPDCLVVFAKEEAEKAMPEGFVVVKRIDGRNLLAIRERGAP